jgi:hypothetical protein
LPQSIKASNGGETAEQRFRAAFERLKERGTPVSQNKVAKEAGCDPTALRKTRFPALVEEIQHWIASHPGEEQPSARQQVLKQRKRNRKARETIADFKLQRDKAVGLLADANRLIVELTEDLAGAKAKNRETSPLATVLSFPVKRGPRMPEMVSDVRVNKTTEGNDLHSDHDN